jgi:hypothetical protein
MFIPLKFIIIGFDPPPYEDFWGVLQCFTCNFKELFGAHHSLISPDIPGRCTNSYFGIFRHVADGIPIDEGDDPRDRVPS